MTSKGQNLSWGKSLSYSTFACVWVYGHNLFSSMHHYTLLTVKGTRGINIRGSLPKNYNSFFIYSSSCLSKAVWLSIFYRTLKKIFWRNFYCMDTKPLWHFSKYLLFGFWTLSKWCNNEVIHSHIHTLWCESYWVCCRLALTDTITRNGLPDSLNTNSAKAPVSSQYG